MKIWNYKQRKCLFTLSNHQDYIRTAYFHHEYPWIVTACDDQTIRIWNWQSRTSIARLSGHTHYTMCAQFHPKEDLLVSASLDGTVRVWDISGLRKRAAMPGPSSFDENKNQAAQTDLFGNSDAIVKFVLEGHDRGVNWASFHPTLPLIASASDDRQVKLWRMNETKAWEVDHCRGHFNNVCCVIFHPRQELILSNSEDRTMRVWDMSKRNCLMTVRREHDRFWMLAAHPEQNLFAAGHDTGLLVFKLERERPPFAVYQDTVYYVKDKYLRCLDLPTGRDTILATIRRQVALGVQPRAVLFNPAENALLVYWRSEGGSYELFQLPRNATPENVPESKRGVGLGAVFVARNRIAVLDKGKQLLVKNLKNELTKQFKVPNNVDGIFPAAAGSVLLRSNDSVSLFDLQRKEVVGELTTPSIKYVSWSQDGSMVALLSRHTLIIANKRLEQLCSIHETIHIKSGVWDDEGIFIFTTLNHLKYALPNGDVGIIRTIEQPLYVTRAKGVTVHCLDRDGKPRMLSILNTEYKFKQALIERKYDRVLTIIRESNLVGQSIIAYLTQKGYAEIALHFVRDEKTRFNLALECGNLQVAVEMATAIDKEEFWNVLADAALKLGNIQVVEMALRRVRNFERLAFLYLVTGNVAKLEKMLEVAMTRKDVQAVAHTSMFLGDYDTLVSLLRSVGQNTLAYVLAASHGLGEVAEAILPTLGLEEAPAVPEGTLLMPPSVILPHAELNWPQLNVSRSVFSGALSGGAAIAAAQEQAEQQQRKIAVDAGEHDVDLDDESGEPSGWGGDDDEDFDMAGTSGAKSGKAAALSDEEDLDMAGGGWEIEDADIHLDLEEAGGAVDKEVLESYYVPPSQGVSFADAWVRSSSSHIDHIAAGSFESAMQLLHNQLGIVNFAPLKGHFMESFTGSRAFLPGVAQVPALAVPLTRGNQPIAPVTLVTLNAQLAAAYRLVTAGKFAEAINAFRDILHSTLFVRRTRNDDADIDEIVSIAREYLLGLLAETVRKQLPKEDASLNVRKAELAAYFACCKMQPIHTALALSSAMTAAYKARSYSVSSTFARRLLDMNPKPEMATQAKKVQAVCDKAGADEAQLNLDLHNPFTVCGIDFVPLYRSSKSVSWYAPHTSPHIPM